MAGSAASSGSAMQGRRTGCSSGNSVMLDEVFTAIATSTLVTLIGVLVVGAALAFQYG